MPKNFTFAFKCLALRQITSTSLCRCQAAGAEDFLLKPLHVKDVQRLRNYVRPTAPTLSGTKRKLPVDLIAENNGSERRPRLAGVAVA